MRIFFVISLLIFSQGCAQFGYSEAELVGEWTAVKLVQDQDTLDYDLSNVALVFKENKRYSYTGNLAEREAGEFYLMGKILYTKDTLVAKPAEKAVQIEALSVDSLRLLMRSAEGLQRLQLVRK